MSWVLVLTADPVRSLSAVDVEAALGAAGVETEAPRRLGPDAVEIVCAAPPALAALRPLLPGVDVNALPAAARAKRLLIADMDSTIIGCECIDEIAEVAGIGPQVAAVTERAMTGELDFEAALAGRVALLQGFAAAALEEVWRSRVRLNPGAEILVRTMAARGAHTALVSGGFTFFTERVAEAAGFAEHRANTLEIEDGRLTGRVVEPILGRAAKGETLTEITARLGIGAADVLALGDGANDLAMVEAAGLGVGYRPKPALAEKADAVIQHADLTAVLHLQGLHVDEFLAP